MVDTLTAPASPVETVTPLRPSEAMRLGAMYGPQAFHALRDGNASCAMGAMYDGYGVEELGVSGIGDLPVDHPVRRAVKMLSLLAFCPVPSCAYKASDNNLLIPAHLNDDHRWTREEIADWLEGRGL